MELAYSMHQDKVTKGAVRYSDGKGHSIYLRKEEAEKLGSPQNVEVTVVPS